MLSPEAVLLNVKEIMNSNSNSAANSVDNSSSFYVRMSELLSTMIAQNQAAMLSEQHCFTVDNSAAVDSSSTSSTASTFDSSNKKKILKKKTFKKSTACSLRSTIDSIKKKKKNLNYNLYYVRRNGYDYGSSPEAAIPLERLEKEIMNAVTGEKKFHILKKEKDYKKELLRIIQENQSAKNKSSNKFLRKKILEDLETSTMSELMDLRNKLMYAGGALRGFKQYHDHYPETRPEGMSSNTAADIKQKVQKFAMMHVYPFNDRQIKNIFGEETPIPAHLEDYYQEQLFIQKVELNMFDCP
jgi:hypothetical protein